MIIIITLRKLQDRAEKKKCIVESLQQAAGFVFSLIRRLVCKVDAAIAITAEPASEATAPAATATAAGCTVHARKFMLPRALHDLTFNVHVTRTRVMYAKAAG